MSFTQPFCLALCSFGPLSLWWLSPGERLDDAVGVNSEKGTTTENQDGDVKYIPLGVYVDDCVCVLSDLTWLSLLGGGRKSWYIILQIKRT